MYLAISFSIWLVGYLVAANVTSDPAGQAYAEIVPMTVAFCLALPFSIKYFFEKKFSITLGIISYSFAYILASLIFSFLTFE
jgi:hypothetical protein